MPYYVGKQSSGVMGAASTWGWGGRSLERTQRGKAAGDGGLMSKGDAPACTVLREIQSVKQRASSCQSIQPTDLYHPRLHQSSPELQPGEGGSWGNHLPLGTKSQELPGTGNSLEELHRAGISYRNKPKPLEALTYKIVVFVLT